MRDPDTQIFQRWNQLMVSGDMAGRNRPVGRVTLGKNSQRDLPSEEGEIFRTLLDAGPRDFELPGVQSIDIQRSLNSDAATCTIVLVNDYMPSFEQKPEGVDTLGRRGYYSPTRGIPQGSLGRSIFQRYADDPDRFPTDWGFPVNAPIPGTSDDDPFLRGHSPSYVLSRLLPNRLLRTWQGYGSDNMDPDGHMYELRDPSDTLYVSPSKDTQLILTGVWLIDSVQMGSDGLVTIACRDMAKLLIEQIAYPPMIPLERYPLVYGPTADAESDGAGEDAAQAQPLAFIGGQITSWTGDGKTNAEEFRQPSIDTEIPSGYPLSENELAAFLTGTPLRRGQVVQDWFWVSENDNDLTQFTIDFDLDGSAPHALYDFPVLGVHHGNFQLSRVTMTLGTSNNGLAYVTLLNGGTPIAPADPAHVIPGTSTPYHMISEPVLGGSTRVVMSPDNIGPDIDPYYLTQFDGATISYAHGESPPHLTSGERIVFRVDGEFLDNAEDSVTDTIYREGQSAESTAETTQTPHNIKQIGDWSDAIIDLATRAGFTHYVGNDSEAEPLIGVHRDTGAPMRVWGDIEKTGVHPIVDTPPDFFLNLSFAECLTKISDFMGFNYWVDESGALVFESSNIWGGGNIVHHSSPADPNTARPESYRLNDEWPIEFHENANLLSYTVTLEDTDLRSEIFAVGDIPSNTSNFPLAAGYVLGTNPITGEKSAVDFDDVLAGQQRLMLVPGDRTANFTDQAELDRFVQMIAVRTLFTFRKGSARVVAHPGLQLNDQVRILDRITHEMNIHYVSGINSTMDLTSGSWTMDVTTHWLGTDPNTDWFTANLGLTPAVTQLPAILEQLGNVNTSSPGGSSADPADDGVVDFNPQEGPQQDE